MYKFGKIKSNVSPNNLTVTMANENQISIVIPDEEIKQINEAFKLIENILNKYVIALSPDERRKKAKMGNKTIGFVEKIMEYTVSNPEFIPTYLKVGELNIDFAAANVMTNMFRVSSQLTNELNDTILLCGSEAYTAALMYYNAVKQASKDNAPGAKTIYEDLKKQFEKIKTIKA